MILSLLDAFDDVLIQTSMPTVRLERLMKALAVVYRSNDFPTARSDVRSGALSVLPLVACSPHCRDGLFAKCILPITSKDCFNKPSKDRLIGRMTQCEQVETLLARTVKPTGPDRPAKPSSARFRSLVLRSRPRRGRGFRDPCRSPVAPWPSPRPLRGAGSFL